VCGPKGGLGTNDSVILLKREEEKKKKRKRRIIQSVFGGIFLAVCI